MEQLELLIDDIEVKETPWEEIPWRWLNLNYAVLPLGFLTPEKSCDLN